MPQTRWAVLALLLVLLSVGCGPSAAERELEKRDARVAELESELRKRDDRILALTAEVNSYQVKDVSDEARKLAAAQTEFEARKQAHEQQLLELSSRAGELKNKQDHLDDMARQRDEAVAFNKSFIVWVTAALGLLVVIGTVAFFLIRWDSSRKEVVLQDRRNRLLLLRDLADRLLEAMKTGASPESIAAFGKSAREIREGMADESSTGTPRQLQVSGDSDKA